MGIVHRTSGLRLHLGLLEHDERVPPALLDGARYAHGLEELDLLAVITAAQVCTAIAVPACCPLPRVHL